MDPETNEGALTPALVRKIVQDAVQRERRRWEDPDGDHQRAQPVDADAIRAQIMADLRKEQDTIKAQEKTEREARESQKAQEKTRQDEIAKLNAAWGTKLALTRAGVRDIDYVSHLYETHVASLTDEAARTASTPEAFLGSLHAAPYLFEDGRAPKAPVEVSATTTQVHAPAPARGPVAETPKDWSGKTAAELKAEIAKLRGAPTGN
jgi:hypothetical protein